MMPMHKLPPPRANWIAWQRGYPSPPILCFIAFLWCLLLIAVVLWSFPARRFCLLRLRRPEPLAVQSEAWIESHAGTTLYGKQIAVRTLCNHLGSQLSNGYRVSMKF